MIDDSSLMEKKPKNPVCAVWWRDAAYTFEKEFPKTFPPLQLTVGFVITANDEFLNIATTVAYDPKTGELSPEDGLLIPSGAKVAFKKIGFLNP